MINLEAKVFVDWLKGHGPEVEAQLRGTATVSEIYHWSQENAGKEGYPWGTFTEDEFAKALVFAADVARFSESPLS